MMVKASVGRPSGKVTAMVSGTGGCCQVLDSFFRGPTRMVIGSGKYYSKISTVVFVDEERAGQDSMAGFGKAVILTRMV